MIQSGDFPLTVHFVDHYLTGVEYKMVNEGGLPDGVPSGSLVWVNIIGDPGDFDGKDAGLYVTNETAQWGTFDYSWDFDHDFVYVASTNTFGRLVLFGISEWRIVPVNTGLGVV